jgi:hypothetical protein
VKFGRKRKDSAKRGRTTKKRGSHEIMAISLREAQREERQQNETGEAGKDRERSFAKKGGVI